MKKTTTNKQVNSYYTSDFDSEFRCLLLITTILFFFASKIQITREKKSSVMKNTTERMLTFLGLSYSPQSEQIGPRHFKYHVV